MKKKIYSTVIGLFALAAVNAQITITAPPLSIVSQIDTFAEPTNKTDFKPYATPATNAHWDFTIAKYPNVQRITLRNNIPTVNYPNAKYSNSAAVVFAGGLGYLTRQYFDFTSNSIICLGEETEAEQVIPLDMITGGANDELVFPKQNIEYSEPDIQRVFPTTLGTSFTCTRVQEIKFNLTIDAYSFNKIPGSRKTYWVVKDSVVGWGTLKIKGISTKAIYDNIPVLQTRRHITQVDSFFLGGNLAPGALLSGFGLSQGHFLEYYYVDFITQDELDELVRIDFKDSPYQTIDVVEIQQNRLEKYATGVEKISLQNAINAYPNPIADNKITIELPANSNANWAISLTDIYGRLVFESPIGIDGEVNLPENIAEGNYILSVLNNGSIISINKVVKQQ
jgi:hypothetical protein